MNRDSGHSLSRLVRGIQSANPAGRADTFMRHETPGMMDGVRTSKTTWKHGGLDACAIHRRVSSMRRLGVRQNNDKTMNWKIEYDNDTGPDDGGFCEWWDVTDGNRHFKCDDENDAKWLMETLNASTPNAPHELPPTKTL